MSFEVDAFMGAPAPPPVRADKPSAPAAEGPSFDDHLGEATTETNADTKPVESVARDKSATDKTETSPEAPVVAPTPAPPPETPAPVMIQLIADAPPVVDAAPVEGGAETPEVAPAAPIDAPAPVKAGETPKNEAPVAPKAGSVAPVAPIAEPSAKNQAPAKAETPEAAPTIVDGAPEEAPVQHATPNAPAQAQAVAHVAPAIRTAQTSEADATEKRSDAKPEGVKLDTGQDLRPAKAEPQPHADAPKANSAPTSGTKDHFAALAALAAQDGPEQAPTQQMQTSTLGSAQLNPQSAQVAADTAIVRAAPAAAQVGREIIRRFSGESTHFEMRLDPPELGKVEVRLEVSRDHKVTAVVTADNPSALAELARNARDLQQALQSAGLELSDTGLSFDLKQQRESRADADSGEGFGRGARGDDETQTPAPASARPIGLESWRGVRVDLVA
ncbi:Mlr2412 protein [alpha proteobacterium U9-1i]|nr:Mlr2412 protein [alpha proteobacterium U9-1i]